MLVFFFFFSSRRRHTRSLCDWSSDVCSSDLTETFAQVFLALTLTCCRCHDHKFDPVTQKEYYQLFAFFNSLDGQEMDGNKKDPVPITKVPSETQGKELARLGDAAKKIEAKLDGPNAELDAAQAGWEKTLAA